ncbi:DUF2125 domain-containing protein [Roseibium sp.]|uniref:DUF2125 domain-containing protein n=1 Tax=Roseibium sp. TaxID=1936156 RepID=UPI003A96DFB9
MDAGPKRNLKLRYGLLGGAVIFVIFAWCAAWFYLSTALKEQIATAVAKPIGPGQVISCPDLSVAGFPFRFEVSCTEPALSVQPAATVEVAGLRTVSLVYKPWHLIAEFAAPLTVTDHANGMNLLAKWQTARSSLIFGTDRLKQFDLSVEDPAIGPYAADDIAVTADKAEIHTRPLPGGSETLEAFVSLDRLLARQNGVQPSVIDVRFHVQLPNGMQLMQGADLMSLVNGDERIPVKLVWASVRDEQSQAELSGDLEIDLLGYMHGKATLTVAGSENLARQAIIMFPQAENTVRLVEGAAMSFGERFKDENGVEKIRLPLTIQNGRVSVGLVPLMVLPPVFLGGR